MAERRALSDHEDAQQRFLSELAEETRDLSDPERVLAVVAQRLGEQLAVSRCAYAEVESDQETFTIRHDYVRDCRSTVGVYRLSLFGPIAASAQRAGSTLVVSDVDRELTGGQGADMFSAIEVKAIICCPLVRAGGLVAMMAVHQTTPRRWLPHEIALVEAVVERSWSYIERARSLRALALSEAQLRQLADALPQIVWAARPDGAIDYYNRRWFEYIDVPPSELERAAWNEHIHADDLQRVYAAWSSALAIGQEYSIEFRIRRGDATYRWFLVRALPVRDDIGQISRWFGTCTDIHEKRLAEEALSRNREQLALVIEGAKVGVWYSPLPLDKFEWDAQAKEHFHLPPDAEVDVDLFYARIHPDDRERTRSAIEASIEQRRPYEIDYRTVSPDGRRVKWIHAVGRTLYDEHGTARRFDGITMDVTSRMLTEIARRESEERFRSMSDSAPVMIWVTRADGYCEYLNQRWYDFTGQAPELAVGFGWLSAVHPDDAGRTHEAFVLANRERTPFHVEYRLRRQDGTYRWCVDAATPRLGSNGEFLGYIGSVIDITDRALAEQERAALLESERAARIEAQRASRMKDEFLATLSHELRTPLNAILGWAHLLRRGPARTDLEKGLDVIERNARAQAQIIEDLLDMSSIVSGKARLEVQPLEFAAVVHAAIETARPAADAKGIELACDLAPNDSVSLSGDANRLQQVLWNLLSNAVKFTPRGGRVSVAVERGAEAVELRVSDTGEGIAAEFLPFVFDRFRQADATSTRRHGGLGLGLAIVKQLVELHGGAVAVHSDGPGRGASFRISLPLRSEPSASGGEEETGADRRASLPPLVDYSHIDLAGAHVLVVDDELDARSLAARVLTEQGAEVSTAGSAKEALALLSTRDFSLLLSDVGMPEEDGYSLLRRVRALAPSRNAQIPAIALTAYARDKDRERALAAGYQLHLTKPVPPALLVTTIASLLMRADRGPAAT